MTAWSDYLRQQALVAERIAETMTTSDAQREFFDIAASYRRDADIEDGTIADAQPASRLPKRPSSDVSAKQSLVA